jgi:hypothetical protein
MTDHFPKLLRTAGLGLLLSAPFLLLAVHYAGFTLDDAFITFRYAKHLAEHGTLAWNLGQDPVEGFTSFLWVLLNAGALKVGVRPLLFSKGLSILSVLLSIYILLWKGTDHPWPLQLGIPAALGLSPAMAVLTVQGLETTVTALLLLGVGATSIRVVATPTQRRFLIWYGSAFLAGLARPDTLVFSAGTFAALCGLFLTSDRSTLRSFLWTSLPFVLLGLAYMSWRIWYFGYLLPNPAYIKGDSLGGGITYTAKFFASVLAPYLIVGAIALTQSSKKRIIEILPTLGGAALFGLYLLNVEPIQGFLWRYAVPVLPALLYGYLHLPWPLSPSHWQSRLGLWALGFVLLLWPLHTYPNAQNNVQLRSAHDRVAVGQALQGLDGRLFTSESGALAYYSEWIVLDLLGLNSESIAHGASRRRALRNFTPDLIGMLTRDPGIVPSRRRWRLTLPYIRDQDYVAVAATRKSENQHHLYFVDPRSPLCANVVSRLRTIPSVSYTPASRLVADSLNIRTAASSADSRAQDACRVSMDPPRNR